MKKKGFSFLELLIVLMIISILFVAFRSSFQVKNKEVVYGQTCIEAWYWQVNNFLHAGLSSKAINSWATQIFPDEYSILFSWQSILLKYTVWQETHTYSNISVSGDTMNYCTSDAYTIMMTGNTYTLKINKWTIENLEYTTTAISTGRNTFLQCDNSWTWCKEIARFESDIRTLAIKRQMCLTFTGAGECFERDN